MNPLRYLSTNIVNDADDTVGLIVHNKQFSSGKMVEQLEASCWAKNLYIKEGMDISSSLYIRGRTVVR